ncbi:MAG: tRNA guanosine(15) transglycosylase TgtA, partial [Candidatus Thermoplasmatota archaeon]|nr:tRNA guanosine(15) transglycosylase TgtA [Candidatus Thermoplasmatota archaeon]
PSHDELVRKFGAKMLITNSYIIERDGELKRRAAAGGLHSLLDFDGPIMTDSGTFQSHVYSDVDIDADEIVDFQKSIGSDILTVLDIFSEPDFSRKQAERSVDLTCERTVKAIARVEGSSIVACPVQGSLFEDLRHSAAVRLSEVGGNYFAVGGVVPLMEEGRYAELASVILSSKSGLNPAAPVHLFGCGHPLIFPLAVLLGCDIFDSASYVKYARDDRMIFPDGTYDLNEMKYNPCLCPVCTANTLKEIQSMSGDDRTGVLARHNLHVLFSEIERIREAIHEERLWDLAESRARSNPPLMEAFAVIKRYRNYIERQEPLSRRRGLEIVDALSLSRPSIENCVAKAGALRPGQSDRLALITGRKPYFTHFDFSLAREEDLAVSTPFGIIPFSLTESYPYAQSDTAWRGDTQVSLSSYISGFNYREFRIIEGKWSRRHSNVPLSFYLSLVRTVCRYQFGEAAAAALLSGDITVAFSKNTGKLRSVFDSGRHILFFRPEDGLFSLKIAGAEKIASAVPPPAMRVYCLPEAVPFVSAGKSLFSKFVSDADDSLRPGSECIVSDDTGKVIACGSALMNREEMLSFKTGIAVSIRDYHRQP